MSSYKFRSRTLTLSLILAILALSFSACSKRPRIYSYNFVQGKTTLLIKSKAYSPRRAPDAVKRAIAAGNQLQAKGYRFGGGHGRLDDSGYDCSGAVSYVLIKAGLLDGSRPSTAFNNYGDRGPGKWITIYVRDGHVFMTVGGLRLDTGFGSEGEGPRWHTQSRPIDGYTMRHPPGL